jgi:putative ABC transport system ATP-binding protein
MELSGGEQQRVAIARAIVGNASVLLADEPTAALDSENGHAIMTVLTQIAKDAARGVLVVTHDPRILPFANRVVRIEDGRIVGEEPGGAAQDMPSMQNTENEGGCAVHDRVEH